MQLNCKYPGASIKQNLFLPLLLGGMLLCGCAVNPVSGDSDFVMLSEQEEVSLGKKEHPSILKQYSRYHSRSLNQYVNQVGQRLARHSHRGHLRFSFTVLDSAQVNAFALPGGYIYITRGLLAYLNSEAELAAVLGHEIGHVTARHGVRQYSAAKAANLGYTLGSLFIPELRQTGAQDLFNVLGGALLSGYGREYELEADRLGAEYLARSGYSPQAMIQVIRVLKNQELFSQARARKAGKKVQTYHGVFSTHPDNDTRLKQVVNSANKLRTPTTRQHPPEAFIQRLNGLVFGKSVAKLNTGEPSLYLQVARNRNNNFRQLARQTPLKQFAEDYLRLLNDSYPAGEPLPNQLLKLIRLKK